MVVSFIVAPAEAGAATNMDAYLPLAAPASAGATRVDSGAVRA